MSSNEGSFAYQTELQKKSGTIYDKIYDRVCSLLTERRISTLRTTLHSMMNQQDLAAFCTDRSKLSLVDYDPASPDRGPVRAFRSTVFCVRLLVFVETNPNDTEIEHVKITAEIQDGERSGTRVLVDASGDDA